MNKNPELTPKIYIIDVTNRDGVQAPMTGLAKLQKTVINLMLNEMGIFQSEIGFPFINHEVNYINANIELAERGVLNPIILSGWCRAVIADIEKALNATRIKHLNLSVPVSDRMIKSKFGGKKTRKSVMETVISCMNYARSRGTAGIAVSAEDASRADINYLIEFAGKMKENGTDRFRYCDTVGYETPFSIYERIKKLAQETKIDIEVHSHNDLGMAVACSVAGAMGAVDAGVNAYINTCINGIGERAGNADFVSTMLALRKGSGLGCLNLLDDRIDLSKSWQICQYAAYAFGLPIPVNQVAMGENVFTHESGIHADGVLKDSRNYELYNFLEVGRGSAEIIETGSRITTGEYGGVRGLRNVYHKLGIEFDNDDNASEILELVRYANIHTQKPLTGYELQIIARYPETIRQIIGGFQTSNTHYAHNNSLTSSIPQLFP